MRRARCRALAAECEPFPPGRGARGWKRSGWPRWDLWPSRLRLVLGNLRPDRSLDVAVDMVRADKSDYAVGLEHRAHLGLDAGQAQRGAFGLCELVKLGQLRGALGVDE